MRNRRQDGQLIMETSLILTTMMMIFVIWVVEFHAVTSTAASQAEEVSTEGVEVETPPVREVRVEVEPETIRFYTSNWFFHGARIILVTSEGRAEGEMPMPVSGPFRRSSDLVLQSPGGMKKGWRLFVYSPSGKFVEYRSEGQTSSEDQMSVYMHVHGVCSNRMHLPELYINWSTGGEIYPVGYEPGPPSPSDWWGC